MEKIEKLKKLSETIERYENNKFRIFLYVPNIPDNVYSMAVEEIYTLCSHLRKNGLEAFIIVEDTKETPYVMPEYLNDELKSQPILSPVRDNIQVEPVDFLIVPEFFVNVMHQINENKIPCERIVLCQSASYMIDSLPPSIKWNMWGFNNVITTSEELKEFILRNTKNSFNVETYQIGIPDYFKPSEIKKPIIMYYSRYETEIKRLSKLFFLKYPELSWVLFERVSGNEPYITRERLAEKMSNIPFLLWLDRDAGFGTLPVEAMKSGAVVVGLVPDVEKEYTKSENTAIWSNSLDIIAEQLGILVKTWLVDEVPSEVYDNMNKVSQKYSVEEHEKTSVQAVLNIRDKKINGFKEVYKKIENE